VGDRWDDEFQLANSIALLSYPVHVHSHLRPVRQGLMHVGLITWEGCHNISFTLCRGCASLPTSHVTHLPRDGQSHTPLLRRRGRVTLRGLYKVPLASENPLQFIGSSSAGIPRLTAIAAKSTQGPPYTNHSSTALAPIG
jgi:hypothetical protein